MKKLILITCALIMSAISARNILDKIKQSAEKFGKITKKVSHEAIKDISHPAATAEKIKFDFTHPKDAIENAIKDLATKFRLLETPITQYYTVYSFENDPGGILQRKTITQSFSPSDMLHEKGFFNPKSWAINAAGTAYLTAPALTVLVGGGYATSILSAPVIGATLGGFLFTHALNANTLYVKNTSKDPVFVTSSGGGGYQVVLDPSKENYSSVRDDQTSWVCQQPFGYDTPCVNPAAGGKFHKQECHKASVCQKTLDYAKIASHGPACDFAEARGFGMGGLCGPATRGPLLSIHNDNKDNSDDLFNEHGKQALGGYITMDTIVNNSSTEYDIATTTAPLATTDRSSGDYLDNTIVAALAADNGLDLMKDIYPLVTQSLQSIQITIGSDTHNVNLLKTSGSPYSGTYISNKQDPAHNQLSTRKHMHGPLTIATEGMASGQTETIILIPRDLSSTSCQPWILIGRDKNATPQEFHVMSYVVKEIDGTSCGMTKDASGKAIPISNDTVYKDVSASNEAISTAGKAEGRLKLTIDSAQSGKAEYGYGSKLELLTGYWVPGGTDFK